MITAGLNNGVKTFVGGNCTVSLMLMSSAACLLRIWWSGSAWRRTGRLPAAARHMRELLSQMGQLHNHVAAELADPASAIPILSAK